MTHKIIFAFIIILFIVGNVFFIKGILIKVDYTNPSTAIASLQDRQKNIVIGAFMIVIAMIFGIAQMFLTTRD